MLLTGYSRNKIKFKETQECALLDLGLGCMDL